MVAPPPETSDWNRRRTPTKEFDESSNNNIQGQLGKIVWESGRKQVNDAFQSYARIDIFRPYFDVQPKIVRNRLFQSLLPRKPSNMQVATDFYGPLMLVLSLVALLLLSMKASGFSMAIYLSSKTRDRSHKIILAASVIFSHISFLVYLHFGFHSVLEEVDEILGESVGNYAALKVTEKISTFVDVQMTKIAPAAPNLMGRNMGQI